MGQTLPCLWIGDYSAKDVITLCQSKHSQYSDRDKGKVHRDVRAVVTVDYPTPGILDWTTWRDADMLQLASDSLDNIHTKIRWTKARAFLSGVFPRIHYT
jgi:hypothetical protein